LKQRGKIIVWLANVDSSKSRREGRKLPRASCIEMPKLAELEDAARALGLESTSAINAARPSKPWERTGFIMMDRKSRTRNFILKSLVETINRSRRTKPKEKPT